MQTYHTRIAAHKFVATLRLPRVEVSHANGKRRMLLRQSHLLRHQITSTSAARELSQNDRIYMFVQQGAIHGGFSRHLP